MLPLLLMLLLFDARAKTAQVKIFAADFMFFAERTRGHVGRARIVLDSAKDRTDPKIHPFCVCRRTHRVCVCCVRIAKFRHVGH